MSTVDVPEFLIASGTKDSSGVTCCIAMKYDGVLYHQVSSFSTESLSDDYFSERKKTCEPN